MASNETREREIVSEMEKISERIRTCKKGENAESCQILLSKRAKLAEELSTIKSDEKASRKH